jgi:uncharacterized protein
MRRVVRLSMIAALIVAACVAASATGGQSPSDGTLPLLTQPVNDFAHVIDPANAAAMDRMIRQLQAATGDVVIVATVETIEPYGDVSEYVNKLFENHGRGIGQKGQNNGLLILLAVKQRRVQIEVGYTLEQWITDGFSGETSRQYIAPQARQGNYGAGLRAGTERIIGRIAEGRGVTLQGVRPVRRPQGGGGAPLPFWVFFIIFIIVMILSRFGGGPGSRLRRAGMWGMGPWSGWSSGVGPFGGGGGGGGFGGGFGGFGGGSSGGGGGGASW